MIKHIIYAHTYIYIYTYVCMCIYTYNRSIIKWFKYRMIYQTQGPDSPSLQAAKWYTSQGLAKSSAAPEHRGKFLWFLESPPDIADISILNLNRTNMKDHEISTLNHCKMNKHEKMMASGKWWYIMVSHGKLW